MYRGTAVDEAAIHERDGEMNTASGYGVCQSHDDVFASQPTKRILGVITLYTALEELNFMWDTADIVTFERMWNDGVDITHIAKSLKRPVDEVAVLAMDRARKNRIKLRAMGVFGKSTPPSPEKRYERLTKEQYLAARNAGQTDTEIARTYAMARSTIQHYVKQWGLSRPRKKQGT